MATYRISNCKRQGRRARAKKIAEFEGLAKGWADGTSRTDGTAWWTVDSATLDSATLDLSVNNQNRVEEKLPTAAQAAVWRKAILKEAFE